MYPCPSNKACAEGTLGLIVRDVPWFLKSFVRNAVISVMEDDVRVGMGLEKPPVWISRTIHGVFRTRQFIVRHMCLPRFSEIDVMPKIDENGRMYRTFWAFEPWYVMFPTDKWAVSRKLRNLSTWRMGYASSYTSWERKRKKETSSKFLRCEAQSSPKNPLQHPSLLRNRDEQVCPRLTMGINKGMVLQRGQDHPWKRMEKRREFSRRYGAGEVWGACTKWGAKGGGEDARVCWWRRGRNSRMPIQILISKLSK